MWRTRVFALFLPCIGLLLFGSLLAFTHQERVDKLKNDYNLYATPPLSGVKPQFLNILLLGNKAVYDDFIAVWLLQTIMQEGTKKEIEPFLAQVRAVIRHSPRLETTYMLSCFAMLYELKAPEHCQEINEAGLRAFPQSWRLLMTQAYVEWFHLKHPAQAASYFTMAAQRENAPPYVQKAARKLLETNTLTDEDVQKSMDIIADRSGNKQFKQILDSIQKSKVEEPKPDAESAP